MKHGIDVLHILFGGLGGQVAVVRGLVTEFDRRGLSSGVCAYAPPGYLLTSEEVWPSARALRPVAKRRRLDLVGGRQIGRIVQELRPRVVLWHSAYGPVGMIRGKWRAAPRCVVLVEHQPLHLRGLGDAWRTSVATAIADAVVYLAPDQARRHPWRHFARALRRTIRVVANGIDLVEFHPAERVDSSPPADRINGGTTLDCSVRVGMAARLESGKDPGLLVEALTILRRARPDLTVEGVIAGDGSQMSQLRALVAHAGLAEAICLPGYLGEGELAGLLRTLDVYVQASHGETLSTAVLQAWATGLPVVATAVGGLRDLITEQDGVLVPEGDADALAAALAALADDPERRERLGRAGRRRVEREFSQSAMADGYLALLSAIDPTGPWDRQDRL